jgi:hypothetical protein
LLVVIVSTGGCGVENWYFDHDAGVENLDAALVLDVGRRDATTPIDTDEDAEVDGQTEPEDEARMDVVSPVPDVTTPCSGDSDCPGAAPHCSQDAGVCTRCQTDVECASDAGPRVCNTSTGACVECVSSADCSIGTMRPYCDTAADRCVQCLSNMNCGFESFCLFATHTCTKMF